MTATMTMVRAPAAGLLLLLGLRALLLLQLAVQVAGQLPAVRASARAARHGRQRRGAAAAHADSVPAHGSERPGHFLIS
jgi:hypothetical protein